MEAVKKEIIKRRNIRFSSDQNTVIELNFVDHRALPKIIGLVTNEAHRGCSFVYVGQLELPTNSLFSMETSDIKIDSAKIVWSKKLADGIYQVGVEYFPNN